MEFEDVVRRRRMVRRYDPTRQPDPADIHALLDLAVRAPSAGFSQGWHFLVLNAQTSRDAFWDASTEGQQSADSWLQGMQSAPVLILAISEPSVYLDRYAEPDKGWTDRDRDRWSIPYWDVDTGMASLLILLSAVDRGLAGCFFGVPAERVAAIRKAFEIPADANIVGVLSIGYPAKDRQFTPSKRPRRPASAVYSVRKYGQSFT